MKKARVLSTIFISLALAGGAARAQLPAQGCFLRDYDAAHLRANPAQGVAGLRLWFYSETTDGSQPAVMVEARMAGQGQAVRDNVAGQVLTQTGICDGRDSCYVECDGGLFTAERVEGGLRLTTRFFAVGEQDSCGGTSDLAEGQDRQTVYQLAAAPDAACETLWRQQPLPGPGCYGIEYSDMERGQGLLSIRLRLGAPEPGYTFAQVQGTFAVALPDGGRARAAGMGGARVSVPVWCSTRDGLCRSGIDEGALAVVPLGQGMALSTGRFLVFGAEAESLDIAQPGGGETRHQLRLLPDDACRGME